MCVHNIIIYARQSQNCFHTIWLLNSIVKYFYIHNISSVHKASIYVMSRIYVKQIRKHNNPIPQSQNLILNTDLRMKKITFTFHAKKNMNVGTERCFPCVCVRFVLFSAILILNSHQHSCEPMRHTAKNRDLWTLETSKHHPFELCAGIQTWSSGMHYESKNIIHFSSSAERPKYIIWMHTVLYGNITTRDFIIDFWR